MNTKLLFVILLTLTSSVVFAEKKSKNAPPPVTRVVGTADEIIAAHKAGVKNIVFDPSLAPVVPPKGRDTKVYDYGTQWSTNYWTKTSDGQRAIVMVARDGSTTTVLQPKESPFPKQQVYQQVTQESQSQSVQATYSESQHQNYVQPVVVVQQQPVYVYRMPRYSTYSYSYWSYGGYRPYYTRPYYGGGCWEPPRYHYSHMSVGFRGGFRVRY